MSQGHYEREMSAAAHRRDLEREAEHERLAASVAQPVRGARSALVALAITGALIAAGLLGFGFVEGAQHHSGVAPSVAMMSLH